MRKERKDKFIGCFADTEDVARLQAICDKHNISRSEAIRYALARTTRRGYKLTATDGQNERTTGQEQK